MTLKMSAAAGVNINVKCPSFLSDFNPYRANVENRVSS